MNEWSWNTHSNMLYIDQPVQAGFSYDTATPGQLELVSLYLFFLYGWEGGGRVKAREWERDWEETWG